MNLGPFSKDIWGLIFSHFEIKFCPYTLKSLTLTCKKLNLIDNERQYRYFDASIKKYGKLILLHPEVKKNRMDHVSFHKYLEVDMIDISTGNFLTEKENYKKTMIAVYPDLHVYLKKLNVENYDELNRLNRNDICEKLDVHFQDVSLIYGQLNAKSFIFSAFSCVKYDSDIVNSLVELMEIIY